MHMSFTLLSLSSSIHKFIIFDHQCYVPTKRKTKDRLCHEFLYLITKKKNGNK